MLKSFAGPFIATFFISMFVLLMQMLWRYIDELVGKGLDFSVIVELLFYFSLSLVPMALPLAVLLSSIMTFGTLGENYELIALKSAGISLYRIMYPLIILILCLCVFTFFFSNNILPIANMRAGNLLYDIKKHKPELSFKEGVFTNDLEGYSIKIDKINKNTGMMYNMLIYNHRDVPGNYEVTRADSGMMVNDSHSTHMELVLFHGNTYTDESMKPNGRKTFPFRRLSFEKQSVLIELPGNEFKRRDEDFITAVMLNLKQLEYTIDSLQNRLDSRKKEETTRMLKANYEKNRNANNQRDSILRQETAMLTGDADSLYKELDPDERKRAMENALQYARDVNTNAMKDVSFYKRQEDQIRKNQIEWHKKFTLPFACLIFFFIGAPLGGIIRKGGLGMPVVISVLLFIIYYVISMMGQRAAKEAVLSMWFGSWLSSLVLLPLGVLLTYKSVTDSEIMNGESYINFFKKITYWLKKGRNAKA
ncbi:LptF/LptG family permease [Odoribacter lunatus]|uniref:LptF/LptG family permease n=1 Tax=Odoribacter lunatus TaxID=2941335 RepID=UPI0020407C8C|nr:LptF/LptG family permease [Odoribacter lunatus]